MRFVEHDEDVLVRRESLVDERQRTRPGTPPPRRTGGRRGGRALSVPLLLKLAHRWALGAHSPKHAPAPRPPQAPLRPRLGGLRLPLLGIHALQAATLRDRARGARRTGGACVSWSDGQPSQVEGLVLSLPAEAEQVPVARQASPSSASCCGVPAPAHRRRQARRHGGLHERRAARLRRRPGA